MELTQASMIFGSVIFALAIVHTFLTKILLSWAHRFEKGSFREGLLHLLGEVEIVFGFWAAVFVVGLCFLESPAIGRDYLESRNYTEPLFVFVIMTVCSTRPILDLTRSAMDAVAAFLKRVFRLSPAMALYVAILTVGPLLGSIITEPAAMTVSALLLLELMPVETSSRFRYATVGLLFVSISIGGTLTSYAAPPVLMVASAWGWDSLYMLKHFGWKAIVAILISTLITAVCFRREIDILRVVESGRKRSPLPIQILHLLFVAAIIASSHHAIVFTWIFLFFIGVTVVTRPYQDSLKIRESLLVGFFLAGLVVIGGPQSWWLKPVIESLQPGALFLSSTILTAFVDNAALTYLGSLVSELSDVSKYALVAGALTGGGLSVIANAPNPAGYGILKPAFGETGLSPLGLLLGALGPTVIAALAFWFF